MLAHALARTVLQARVGLLSSNSGLANLEARMSNMEQMLGRILIAIEDSIPGSEGHSD